jgi:hypothetical protein
MLILLAIHNGGYSCGAESLENRYDTFANEIMEENY